MSKFLIVPAVVFMGLIASCNSGADTAKEEKVDSLVTKIDTSMHHDMSTTGNVEPVPEIPAGAKVYFKNLKDGQSVTSPVKIEMGADGIKVDTAGVVKAGVGHHHLLIDADPTPSGTIVAKDSTHIHFGKAQTQATIPLTPGKHKLTLQFADGIHRSYGSQLTSSITVDVKK